MAKCECYLEDQWIEFHFQTKMPLDQALKEFSGGLNGYNYLGSGVKKRYDGTPSTDKEVYHYFKRGVSEIHNVKKIRYRLIKEYPGRRPQLGKIVRGHEHYREYKTKDGFVMGDFEVCDHPEYWHLLSEDDLDVEIGDVIRDVNGNLKKIDGLEVRDKKVFLTTDGGFTLIEPIKGGYISEIMLTSNKLTFGSASVTVQIPNCPGEIIPEGNWNSKESWMDFVKVTCQGETGTLRFIKNLIDVHQSRFGKVQLKSRVEIGCLTGTIEELKHIYTILEAFMRPIIDNPQKRNYKLTLD